jgi:hypothetical protein
MRMKKIASHENNSRSKSLFIEMTPSEHGVLRVEAAITGSTMGDIVRNRLIMPLKEKHVALLNRIGDGK